MARWSEVRAAIREDSSSSDVVAADDDGVDEDGVCGSGGSGVDLEVSSFGSAAARSAANCCCW